MTEPIVFDTLVLKYSSHRSPEDGLCAMEAVAWMAGEPHSDKPKCACPVVGAFMRSWNDGIKDDVTRTRLLKPLLPILVGSRSTKEVELQRSYLALDWLTRVQAPAWLDLRDDLKDHAAALRGLSPLVDVSSCKAAQGSLAEAMVRARASAGDGAWAATNEAPRAAAGAAAVAAASAGHEDKAVGDVVPYAASAAAWASRAAAVDALAPTVAMLQESAVDLVRRMCEVR